MRGKDTPSDRQKTLKMSLFKPSGGLALTSPKGQETGGLATTFSGSHLTRASQPGLLPTPSQRSAETHSIGHLTRAWASADFFLMLFSTGLACQLIKELNFACVFPCFIYLKPY